MNLIVYFRIIHLACTFIFHFTIMRDLEKMAGWLRLAIIYIFSGIGGYLYSAILLPYQAEVINFCFLFLFLQLLVSFILFANTVDLKNKPSPLEYMDSYLGYSLPKLLFVVLFRL